MFLLCYYRCFCSLCFAFCCASDMSPVFSTLLLLLCASKHKAKQSKRTAKCSLVEYVGRETRTIWHCKDKIRAIALCLSRTSPAQYHLSRGRRAYKAQPCVCHNTTKQCTVARRTTTKQVKTNTQSNQVTRRRFQSGSSHSLSVASETFFRFALWLGRLYACPIG